MGNFQGLSFHAFEHFAGHNAKSFQAFAGYQGVTFFVVFEGGFYIAAGQFGAVSNVIAITTDEAAGCFQAADNFQAFAENFCRKNFHGSFFNVSAYIVSFNASFFENFKEEDGSFQVCSANAFDGEAYSVFARIKNAVFAGAIIFKFQQYVTVFQLVNVFGFTGINFLHNR